MDRIFNWTVKRAGSGLTVTHSTGKITEIGSITVVEGKVIATRAPGCGSDGRQFELVVS